ncbi:GNAT family N-acetyltransferase [Mycolicibacterium pulveris]
MLTVVPRQPRDLLRCVDLLWAVHTQDHFPIFWPSDPVRWLAPPYQVSAWVARDTETAAIHGHVAAHLVGNHRASEIWTSACGLPADRLVVLSRLIVSPTYRRRQLGKKLLTAATRFAQEQGALAVLDVAQDNLAAISLYESLGWRRVGSLDVAADRKIPVFAYISPDAAAATPAKAIAIASCKVPDSADRLSDLT